MADFMNADMGAFDDVESPLANFLVDETEDEEIKDDDKSNKDDDAQPKDDETKDDVADKESDKESDDEDTEDIDKGSPSNTSNSYSALITAMGEPLSYLRDDNVDIKNAEEFTEYIESKLEAEIQARELVDLNDAQKEYLEQLRAGVPEPEIRQALSFESQIGSITDDDIESNEELRESLIYQSFKQDGLSDTRAKKLTKFSIDAGEDIETAKESLIQLKDGITKTAAEKKQAALKSQEDNKKAYDDQMKKLKETINSPEEVLGSKTLTKKYGNDLYNLITKPQKHDGKDVNFLSKFLLENPVDANVILGHLYLATDGFKADKINGLNAKAVKSKAAKSISKIIEKGTFDFSNDNNSNDLEAFKNEDFKGLEGLEGLF